MSKIHSQTCNYIIISELFVFGKKIINFLLNMGWIKSSSKLLQIILYSFVFILFALPSFIFIHFVNTNSLLFPPFLFSVVPDSDHVFYVYDTRRRGLSVRRLTRDSKGRQTRFSLCPRQCTKGHEYFVLSRQCIENNTL